MATQPVQDLRIAVVDAPRSDGPFPRLPVVLSPERRLLHYYVLACLLLGPAFILGLVPAYFRYRTMRYEIDEEGITMRWGFLFRREISITYARVQDIHLSSNLVERWLGLAKVQIQTASGSSKAEMTIEGLRNPEGIRDFLYSRMRGARDASSITASASTGLLPPQDRGGDELVSALRDVAAEIRALREALNSRGGGV